MNNYNNMNNLNKLSIIGFVICVIFIVFGTISSVQAMTNEKTASSYDNKVNVNTIYIRGSDGAVMKRLFSKSGIVQINHTAGLTSGSLNMCLNETNTFGYSPKFTFSAGGGSWDTPHGLWVGNINQNRTKEVYSSTYWQKFYDTGGGGRWGKIAWSAVKPVVWNGTGYGSGKVYMSSNNNSVVSCVGMKCTAKGRGTATITAHFPPVVTRMWTWARFSKPTPKGSSDWISEHWQRPGAVNDIKPNWMFCPTVRTPSNDNINYCANRLTLPAKTVSWTATVGSAARCNYCGDKKITSPEACDTTAGSSPSGSCTAEYDSTCNYCVPPKQPNQCTWQTIVGPNCGDDMVNGNEDCDAGINNGLPCTAAYNSTCQYCSNSCATATAVGPHCGDNIKNGTEECDGTDGVLAGEECTNSCTINYIAQCGNKDGVLSNTLPVNPELCEPTCNLNGNPFLQASGNWSWQCTQPNDPANPKTVDCSAPSCLAGMPVEFQRYVYFDSDGNPQNASVSVNCPNVCCRIEGTANGDYIVCSGDTNSEIEVTAGSRTYPTECWFDDDSERDDDETVVNVPDVSISTMCTSRECNAQGTCQATPQVSDTANGCTSTCNSNADCSTGRIIETRP